MQQWLAITHDEHKVLHPEINYQSVVNIWNTCYHAHISMTDEEVMTMLQGPLRIPRQNSHHSNKLIKSPPTNICASIPRYSSSLLLLCYYFLFHTDAYSNPIANATLHSISLGSTPLFTYLSQHWDRLHWLSMLSNCKMLDFHALARRQQDRLAAEMIEYASLSI